VATLAAMGGILLQFILLDDRVPLFLFPYQVGLSHVVTVDRQLCDCDEFLIKIKERFLQSQTLMKQGHGKKRTDVEFGVDDWVWLRLNQRAAMTVRTTGPSKLGAKFFGPYQVTTKIGLVSNRLQLPPHAKIHNVFHVVFLKKFEGSPSTSTPPLPPIVRGRTVAVPENVVRTRPTATSWICLCRRAVAGADSSRGHLGAVGAV
jgi:hypothetical protein